MSHPAATSTAQQAYDAIKNLEAQGIFPIPKTAATILIGKFDANTGKFGFSVPTRKVTTIVDPGDRSARPPRPPITSTSTVGQVVVFAVNLSLKFIVANPHGPFTVSYGSIRAWAASGENSITLNVGSWSSTPNAKGELPTFTVQMSSGDAFGAVELQIMRPPIVTAGAFTIPAVPTAIVYAPPPGPQNKSFAEYSDMTSTSRKVSSSVSSAHSTKSVTAFARSDFLDKTGRTLAGIQNLIAAFQDSNTQGELKQVGGSITVGLDLLSGILSSTSSSTTDGLTTTNEHDLLVTDTETSESHRTTRHVSYSVNYLKGPKGEACATKGYLCSGLRWRRRGQWDGSSRRVHTGTEGFVEAVAQDDSGVRARACRVGAAGATVTIPTSTGGRSTCQRKIFRPLARS
jgi:hypothetical protein